MRKIVQKRGPLGDAQSTSQLNNMILPPQLAPLCLELTDAKHCLRRSMGAASSPHHKKERFKKAAEARTPKPEKKDGLPKPYMAVTLTWT